MEGPRKRSGWNLITISSSQHHQPAGDITVAADFLQTLLEKEGVPITRYEGPPGKSNLAARLKGSGQTKPILLLHHMDVVSADWRALKGQAVKWGDHRISSEWHLTTVEAGVGFQKNML